MSAGAAIHPFTTKTGLAGGLARCSASRAHAEADGPVRTTTGREYGAPGPDIQRTLPILPPPPASVMHCCRGLRFPPISHSHAIHAAPKDASARTDSDISSVKSSNMHATHLHISADKRLETCTTTTGENFQPVPRMLPAATIRKPAASASKFTHYCATGGSSSGWTATYESTFSPHNLRHVPQRKTHLVTKNAGCCPITGAAK